MASQRRESGYSRRSILRLAMGAAFVPMAPTILCAQVPDLPSGPIRVILPTLHGGQADTLGRLIGDRVGPAIDRSFVVEPRAGAGGLIAGEYVARAVPDGNTLLFVTGGHTTLPDHRDPQPPGCRRCAHWCTILVSLISDGLVMRPR